MQIADQQDNKAKDRSLRQLLQGNGKPVGAAADCDLFSAGTNAVQVSGFTLSAGAL